MPGTSSSAAADVVTVGATIEDDRPSATRRDSSTIVRRRLAGIGSSGRIDVGQREPASGRRGSAVRRSTASGSPTAATMRPATVLAPATEICWPIDGPHRGLERVDAAGHAQPGRGGDQRCEHRVGGEGVASMATGSASRSSRRRTRWTAAREVPPVLSTTQPDPHRPVAVRRARGELAVPWPWGRSNERWNVVPSQASTPGTARAARKAKRCSAANGARTASSRSTALA